MSALRVLRLCSVFEPPASALGRRGAGFDPIGGMQDHTGALTRLLARRGIAQVVLTTRPPTAPWIERIAPNATVVRVGLPVRRARQLYALPAGVLAPLLGRRADLVHVHLGEDLAILPLAALAARQRRVPIVLTVHCSLAHTLEVSDARTALLRALGARIERWGERRAAATIVLTDRLADRLAADTGFDGVRLIPRGIDRRRFADPGPDPFPSFRRRPRIVYLGRIVRAKGMETLVEAISRLRTSDAGVLVVGDGPARAAVERLARRLGVDDRIAVTGFVPHDRVPAVLAAADLVVLPSFYEELGTVLIEAMQVGVPVVASRVGGIPDVVIDGHTGLLVPPGDAGALAAAIDAILGNPRLARHLGANAGRLAPRYDLERVGDQVEALYAELAQGLSAAAADLSPAQVDPARQGSGYG
jgi:glycosyltransferase involved in cell wall biosynthesis